MVPAKRAATPETPPNMTVSSLTSPKQAELELEAKIREKRKEIEALEAQLAEEKARRLQESAKKKKKCDEHFTSPDLSHGQRYLIDRVKDMLKEMNALYSKELPDSISLYRGIHDALLALTGPQLVLPFDDFTMEEINTLDLLKGIIQGDMRHLTHLRASLGSIGNFFPERLAAMAGKVEELEDE
ncbi:hypothetical protein DIS24_g2890 [Lasiodiplodia hormozganensis]|uniref:Uncharacterized protein n=1 Tax=Lasiodiplodia hormozganensis TaxID=869390 RepID=A0AA39YYY6_9PEZI|nr:hypothetical protein DIS24_g2890 [Lasiodiplodia hormozganensis]